MLTMKTVALAVILVCMALPVAADEFQSGFPTGDVSGAMPVDPDQGKSYSINCYLGNPDDGRNLGSLTVTSVTEAGPACNSTFGNCNDSCYGCLTDGSGVCVDRFGSKIQR